MSKALELADWISERPWAWETETFRNCLYDAAAELRRLDAIEAELKAIKEAEPIGWVGALKWKQDPRSQSEQVVKMTRNRQEQYGYITPLYTLEGKS